MITSQAIVAEARSWIKPTTKWRHQACLKGVAADCIGLVGGVALALGIPGAQEWADDPELHCYGRTPDPRQLLAGCERFMDRIPVPHASVADVLVMAFDKDPQHFALISSVDPTYLIHSYTAVRRVVENGINISGARILRAYRFRGIA